MTGRPGTGRLDIVRRRTGERRGARLCGESASSPDAPEPRTRRLGLHRLVRRRPCRRRRASVDDARRRPAASAFVSTQASTKVVPHRLRGRSVEIEADVASGGQLVVWPDPVVCFAGSRYEQRQHFELEAGAALVLVDWMTSGRRDRESDGASSATRAGSQSATIGVWCCVIRCCCPTTDGDLAARMGRFDVLATAAVIGTAPTRRSIGS